MRADSADSVEKMGSKFWTEHLPWDTPLKSELLLQGYNSLQRSFAGLVAENKGFWETLRICEEKLDVCISKLSQAEKTIEYLRTTKSDKRTKNKRKK